MASKLNLPKKRSNFNQDATEGEFDVRQDEEQGVKLNQIIDLLLAAGYFRARIKDLSPFDKVVGGMVWCITTSNYDIDVDLLFQENLSIGEKIQLSEKAVTVLQQMKCPHRLEPHQIRGLDFIHIFPVIQWLVKKAIETREELGDYMRVYTMSQFDKYHQMPSDKAFESEKAPAAESVSAVKMAYRPQRIYRRHDLQKLKDEESNVQSTLLEYGKFMGAIGQLKNEADKSKSGEGSTSEDTEQDKHLKMLMSGMSAASRRQNKVMASAVESIVGLQAEQIQKMSCEYMEKQGDLPQKSEIVGGAQQHQRLTTALTRQIEQQKIRLCELSERHKELAEGYKSTQNKLTEVQENYAKLQEEFSRLTKLESGANEGVLQQLRSLVAMNENLKKQEQDFKAHCKEELARLQDQLSGLKAETGMEGSEEDEQSKRISVQYDADSEKLHKLRSLLAKRNRDVAVLFRKLDEVPSRAELIQYQRRFIELYNQVAAKHKESKQFFTLYNTSCTIKLYMEKEIGLLNSIHDNFEYAIASTVNKEDFLKQLEKIVEGMKQNRAKVEKKKQEEKMRRDQLNDQYLELVDKQRLYFKSIKDFKDACHKNEVLMAKVQSS